MTCLTKRSLVWGRAGVKRARTLIRFEGKREESTHERPSSGRPPARGTLPRS